MNRDKELTRSEEQAGFDAGHWPSFRGFPSVFQRFFEPMQVPATQAGSWTPSVDIEETPEAYEFNVEVPGIKPEDIRVSVTDDHITIEGERSYEERKEENNVIRTERSYGSFQRTFRFPTTVDTEKVGAETRDGILHVVVAKQKAARPRRVEVRSK